MNATDSELQESLSIAKTLSDLGKLVDAQSVLVAGLRLARKRPEQGSALVRELGSCYARTQNFREAISCAWFAFDTLWMDKLQPHIPPRDQARTMAIRANMCGLRSNEGRTWSVRSAEAFEKDRRWVHASKQWMNAGKHERALEHWRGIGNRMATRGAIAIEALCRVNQARCARDSGDLDHANGAIDRAVSLLQEWTKSHARLGRTDLAVEGCEILLSLAQKWGRKDLIEQTERARTVQLARDLVPIKHSDVQDSAMLNLLTWECGWEVAEMTADWLVNPPDSVARELALELRLLSLETDGKPSGAVMYPLCRLAHGLGDGGYAAIPPLEVLAKRRAPAVRVAVARSLGRLGCRRSLRALTAALGDPSPTVVQEARTSIASMHNPCLLGGILELIGAGTYAQAFPPNPSAEATRQAAFRALVGMSNHSADEMIRWILEHGGASDRRLLNEALSEKRTSA